MHSQIRILNETEIQQVSAGHSAFGLLLFLEIPHMIVGLIEFTNYFGERWNNGCENIDEHDYFAQGMCATYKYIESFFS